MGRYVRIILTALLIVSGVFVFLPSGYVSAGGMIDNQSFEEGTGEVPSAWNLTGNATRVHTGPIYVGNWTARITGDGGTFTQWVYLGDSTIECGNETIPMSPMPMTYNAWGMDVCFRQCYRCYHY
jgi:ubiquitin C-terminal hydrolase